jgi:hypothetical protein
LAVGGVVVARKNTALLSQALVGAVVAAFVVSTLLAPFSIASALIGGALTAAVGVAGLALLFEVTMLPFGGSAIGLGVPPVLAPWVLLGVLGSLSVVSGLVELGVPADVAIVLMRAGTPAAFVASGFMFLRSRRAS